MAKLTLNNVLSGFLSVVGYNTNNDLIEAALENTLSRDGTSPNQMGANLDMDSNRIINLPEPINAAEAARLVDVQNAIAGNSTANLVGFTPYGNIVSTSVQGAIQEEVDDLAASSGSSLVGYIQSGTGAILRTVQDKERDIVSVKDFGAISDGVDTGTEFTGTDNTAAFQAALDYCGLNRKKLYVPAGIYRFAPITTANTHILTINYTSVNIVGDGSNTTELLIDDDITDTSAFKAFIGTTNIGASTSKTLREAFKLSHIALRGRWTHAPTATGGTHPIFIENFSEVVFDSIALFDIRGKGTLNSIYFNSVRVQNSRFERIASDCIRFLNANHVSIVNNTFKWVDDDVIALPLFEAIGRTSATVTGNNFEQCETIIILGAKNTVVSGNTFKFSKSAAIYVGGADGTSGDTEAFSVVVTGNSVIDPMMRYDSTTHDFLPQGINNSAIGVATHAVSLQTTASAYPTQPTTIGTSFITPTGIDSNGAFLAYTYLAASNSIPPGFNFVVANNSVLRTLPATTNFSDYGFGLIYSAVDGWVDPAVALTHFNGSAITLVGDMRSATVTGNVISGFPNGAGVYMNSTSSTTAELAFNNILISNNIMSDVFYGVTHNRTASTSIPYSWVVVVTDNIIDCDTYHTASARTSPLDGTWQTGIGVASRPIGVYHRQSKGWVIKDNIFANCYDAVLGNAIPQYSHIKNNILLCNPVVVGFSTSNQGIGDIGIGGESYIHQVTMCDPRTQISRNVTLTRSSFTVTATSISHALVVGQSIIVSGADQAGYNGQWIVDTVPTADTFTYIITTSPTSPATGTITATPASYGKHIWTPILESSSVPTIGIYVTGHFVKNTTPITASSKTTLGWVRQTVGSGHTVATTTTADWAPIVATTS